MTDIFTATYGTRIRSRGFPHPIEVDDSTFGWQPLKHYVGGSMMDNAMAEWYQHRRDVELGRWRSKNHPNYVVYPQGSGAIEILCEIDGRSHTCGRDCPHIRWMLSYKWAEVQEEYFAVHPEPAPAWHSAQPGEAWLLTIDGTEHPAQTIVGRIAIYPHDADPEFFIPTLTPVDAVGNIRDHTWSPTDPGITAGRRLYPEFNDE